MHSSFLLGSATRRNTRFEGGVDECTFKIVFFQLNRTIYLQLLTVWQALLSHYMEHVTQLITGGEITSHINHFKSQWSFRFGCLVIFFKKNYGSDSSFYPL